MTVDDTGFSVCADENLQTLNEETIIMGGQTTK